MAFATTNQLASRFRVLTEAEEAQATVLLGDAAFWLKVWFKSYGDLEALATADPLLVEGLEILSCSMVKRALLGGDHDNATAVSDAAGVFSRSVTYSNPEGNLYVLSWERDGIFLILGAGSSSGAVSMTARGF